MDISLCGHCVRFWGLCTGSLLAVDRPHRSLTSRWCAPDTQSWDSDTSDEEDEDEHDDHHRHHRHDPPPEDVRGRSLVADTPADAEPDRRPSEHPNAIDYDDRDDDLSEEFPDGDPHDYRDDDGDDAPPGLISSADAVAAMHAPMAPTHVPSEGPPAVLRTDYADLPAMVPVAGSSPGERAAAAAAPPAPVLEEQAANPTATMTPDFGRQTAFSPETVRRQAKEAKQKAHQDNKQAKKEAKLLSKLRKSKKKSQKRDAAKRGEPEVDAGPPLWPTASADAPPQEAAPRSGEGPLSPARNRGAWETGQPLVVNAVVAAQENDSDDDAIPALGGRGRRVTRHYDQRNRGGDACLGGCEQDPPTPVILGFEPAEAIVQMRDAEDEDPSSAEDALLHVENCTRFAVARFFRLLRTFVNIVLVIAFEALRFVLTLVTRILVDLITISSHSFFKPLLNTFFNQLFQPLFVVIREAFEAFKLIVRPLFTAFDPVADLLVKILRFVLEPARALCAPPPCHAPTLPTIPSCLRARISGCDVHCGCPAVGGCRAFRPIVIHRDPGRVEEL